MNLFAIRDRARFFARAAVRLFPFSFGCGLLLTLSLAQGAQTPAARTPDAADATGHAAQADAPDPAQGGGITDDELKQLLVGKALYLRGGYLENTLNFDEHGGLTSKSPQGSYTLSAIQIDKVRLTKHKVDLEGARYGLHFVGQLASEDPTSAVDRVRITPRKKKVKITIDREIVVKPKKVKDKDGGKGKKGKKQGGASSVAAAGTTGSDVATPVEPAETSQADERKASMAAAAEAERSPVAKIRDAKNGDGKNGTTTSPAHATRVLKDALDRIFASGLDERMMAAMPEFWKLYYEAVAAKTDYRPKDAAVLRQNFVDRKARLVSTFEPASNEFAQANGVAGMSLYHTVIGADGKPGEIAVGRPIGFGLDENAVESIRKASFEPAMKDGKPVPVLLDLVVQFRIYSKRAAVVPKVEQAEKPVDAALPGPFSLQHP